MGNGNRWPVHYLVTVNGGVKTAVTGTLSKQCATLATFVTSLGCQPTALTQNDICHRHRHHGGVLKKPPPPWSYQSDILQRLFTSNWTVKSNKLRAELSSMEWTNVKSSQQYCRTNSAVSCGVFQVTCTHPGSHSIQCSDYQTDCCTLQNTHYNGTKKPATVVKKVQLHQCIFGLQRWVSKYICVAVAAAVLRVKNIMEALQ